MKSTQIVIGVVAALAIAGAGFAAGMTYEKTQSPAPSSIATTGTTPTGGRGGTGARGAGGAGGALAGQVPINGRVLAVNDGSITVAAVERGQGQQAAGASPTTTSQIVLVGTKAAPKQPQVQKVVPVRPTEMVLIRFSSRSNTNTLSSPKTVTKSFPLM